MEIHANCKNITQISTRLSVTKPSGDLST